MKDKDRVCLLDAPLSSSGLFGDAVNSVVDRFQEASKQAAAFQRFPPSRSRAQGAAGQQPSTSTSSSYREAQKESAASRGSPRRSQKQRYSSGTSGRSRIWGPCLRLGGPRKRSPDTWGCRTSEGRPLWGRRSYRVPISPQCPRRCAQSDARGLRHTSPLRGVYKTDSSGSAWRLYHHRGPSYRSNTRGQPRETGSLSRLFGSMETTARCISMGPADCRKGVSNSVRLSTTALQRRDSHTWAPSRLWLWNKKWKPY